MVQINFAQKEIQCKIVYYGPGMSGKTTNLELVHGKVPSESRGELTSIATTGERTLYFDYMPLDLGQIAGIRTKFQLYTVPGQIYYKSTRRLVLQGVDGIVFVADSSAAKLRENKESLADLEENLREMGKTLKDVPIVIQYNKRDLPDAMTVEQLEREINPHGFPHFEAVAPRGEGVFPTLKDLAGRVLETVNQGGLAKTRSQPVPRRAPVAAKAPAPAAAAPAHERQPAMAAAGTATPAPPQIGGPGTHAPVAPPSHGHGFGHGRGGSHGSGPPSAPPAPPPRADVPAARPPAAPSSARAPAPSFDGRSFEDRMVKVSGLGAGTNRIKVPIILALLALIAGAAFFALSGLF